MNQEANGFLERAEHLHRRALVIDTHSDTTQRFMDETWDPSERHGYGHVDIPRLQEGGVDAMFFAVWAPGPIESGQGVAAARRQIARIHEVVSAHEDALVSARTSDEIRAAQRQGRVAVVIAIEGGYLIEDSLAILREYHEAGAAYLTLTHSFHTTWADSAGVHESLPPRHDGLTAFGREVVGELNRLGMMVDVSHVSDKTFWDVVETTRAPIIATHSSSRAVSPHRRNLTDDMIRAIADSGGVVQINFASLFIDPNHPPVSKEDLERWWDDRDKVKDPVTSYVTPLAVLVDHFDHAMKLVGPRHVGIGSDFDGVPAVPAGMEDCSKLPNLTAELLRRGYGEDDLTEMLGANVLRVMDACRAVAE